MAGAGGLGISNGVDPTADGQGGFATGGNGGNGGESGIGIGGGVFIANTGKLTLEPRLGAKSGSTQAGATDVITANQAKAGSAGSAGLAGGAEAEPGHATPGNNGTVDTFSVGIGGGIAIIGTAVIDNTSIFGNQATTADPDVDGKVSS